MEENIFDRSARADILKRIREDKPDDAPLPDVPMYRVAGDAVENFKRELEGFDGKVIECDSRTEAIETVKAELGKNKSANIYSTLADYEGNFRVEEMSDPHDASKIDTTVTESELGVGETGSLWVTEKSLGVAAAGVMALHLIILIRRDRIVDGMHTAYSKLDLRDTGYGVFYTGPSATADIEAVRVTGAQGPLSLTAIIYG